jgi:hypothetical protein
MRGADERSRPVLAKRLSTNRSTQSSWRTRTRSRARPASTGNRCPHDCPSSPAAPHLAIRLATSRSCARRAPIPARGWTDAYVGLALRRQRHNSAHPGVRPPIGDLRDYAVVCLAMRRSLTGLSMTMAPPWLALTSPGRRRRAPIAPSRQTATTMLPTSGDGSAAPSSRQPHRAPARSERERSGYLRAHPGSGPSLLTLQCRR